MKSKGKTVAKIYCAELKRYCPRAFGKKIFPALESRVLDFCEDNDEITRQELEAHFGEPEQFVASYVGGMDDFAKLRLAASIRLIKVGFVAATAVLLIIAVIVGIIVYNENTKPILHYSVNNVSAKSDKQ